MSGFFLQGFGMGGGLIIAIGAQNAFVLSQGIKRQYHWIVAIICMLADVSLIALGVTGMGTFIASNKTLGQIAALGGAVFLFWYGYKAFRSVFQKSILTEENYQVKSLKGVLLTTLGVTLLNPHVYLDTIVLLGSIAGQFEPAGRYLFGLGAMSASIIWFFSLALGGKFLAPVFRNPTAWKILDFLIGTTMWVIALQLISRI